MLQDRYLQKITSSQWSLLRDFERRAAFRLNKSPRPLDGVFSLSSSVLPWLEMANCSAL